MAKPREPQQPQQQAEIPQQAGLTPRRMPRDGQAAQKSDEATSRKPTTIITDWASI